MLLTTPDYDQDATEGAIYTKAKQVPPTFTRSKIEHRCDILSRASKHRMGKCACLGVKNIGKPCALIAHARFDEGGQVMLTMAWLLRHRQTKGAETDMLGLRNMETCSLLYPLIRK